VCAETIKAAAIRCRYCQAELTPIEATPPAEPVEASPEVEATDAAEPVEAPEEPTESDSGSEPQPSPIDASVPLLESRRLTAILATLALLAAAGVGIGWWRAEHSSAISAPDGALVGDAPRSEAIIAAADLTQRALSYDYRSLANDMEIARARMTPSFRKEYDGGMAPLRANTMKNKIVVEADVVASSIITASEHKARLLVFSNLATSAKTTEAKRVDRNSLLITLVRGKGDWMLSDLTALG
jgi:Mce-associated membrane protein